MPQASTGFDPAVQNRLGEVAQELRVLLYGEAACPQWGTTFAEIEAQDMAIGRELSRLMMEQSLQSQAKQMPDEALQSPGETIQQAGVDHRVLQTEAGEVEWDEPLGYLKKSRRSFSPSVEGAGDRRG